MPRGGPAAVTWVCPLGSTSRCQLVQQRTHFQTHKAGRQLVSHPMCPHRPRVADAPSASRHAVACYDGLVRVQVPRLSMGPPRTTWRGLGAVWQRGRHNHLPHLWPTVLMAPNPPGRHGGLEPHSALHVCYTHAWYLAVPRTCVAVALLSRWGSGHGGQGVVCPCKVCVSPLAVAFPHPYHPCACGAPAPAPSPMHT
jgi:hypothetical protein